VTKTSRRNRSNNVAGLQKERTGIPGFDEITGGGVPAGRPTLVCGSAGAGKTLFAMEFLVRGAPLNNEPRPFEIEALASLLQKMPRQRAQQPL